MTQFLPPNLLALFAPRDPVPYLPPPDKLPHEKKNRGYVGVGNFLRYFEDPKDTPPPTRVETREERLERRRRERAEQVAYKLEQEIAVWDPHSIPTATGDPFKTLFVARINYDSSESKLRREFEVYGPIKKIVVTHNKVNGKPRGYAFIEYEHERDMHSAYKHADGKKIDGRRVLVDVERARTVKGWLPRRLGGGLGGTRRGGPDVNIKHSGREDNERERERYRLERERETARGGNPDRERVDRERPERERRRSRSREREREKRRKSRSRSRERKRRRSRERVKEKDPDIEEVERDDRDRVRDRDRERDRDRDRKRRRSRSRERDRERDRKRDRRDRDRGDRGERDTKDRRDREFERSEEKEIRIKQEPPDDYPDYSQSNYDDGGYEETQIKYEREGDEDMEPNGRNYNNEYEDAERREHMVPVITTSPSEDHTYSAGSGVAAHPSSSPDEAYEEGSESDDSSSYYYKENILKSRLHNEHSFAASHSDSEEQRKIAEGADALLNLAGIPTRKRHAVSGHVDDYTSEYQTPEKRVATRGRRRGGGAFRPRLLRSLHQNGKKKVTVQHRLTQKRSGNNHTSSSNSSNNNNNNNISPGNSKLMRTPTKSSNQYSSNNINNNNNKYDCSQNVHSEERTEKNKR